MKYDNVRQFLMHGVAPLFTEGDTLRWNEDCSVLEYVDAGGCVIMSYDVGSGVVKLF